MEHELSTLKNGYTKVINGQAVTRWSDDFFEVGTWGRKMQTKAEALEALSC